MGERQLRVEPHPGATGAARRFILCTLDAWRVPEPWPILLTGHELVANALWHTHTPALLRIRYGGAWVRVEVADTDPGALQPVPAPDRTAVSGRGLYIVSQLAARWGVERANDGKTVWAELPVPVIPASRAAPTPTRTQ